jgi:hypothetical protein
VIEADGIAVQDLAASPRDIQWAEAVKGSDEDIRLAFGVAESVLGNASGRTFANADAEEEGFYKHAVTDHCNPIANALDELTNDLGDDIRPYFDWTTVEALQRPTQTKRAKADADFDSGKITLNEWRKINGMDEFDHPYARVIIHPTFGVVGVGSEEDIDAVAELPNVAQPKQPEMEPGQEQGAFSYAYQVDDPGSGQPAIEEGVKALSALFGAIQSKAVSARPKVIKGEIE